MFIFKNIYYYVHFPGILLRMFIFIFMIKFAYNFSFSYYLCQILLSKFCWFHKLCWGMYICQVTLRSTEVVIKCQNVLIQFILAFIQMQYISGDFLHRDD